MKKKYLLKTLFLLFCLSGAALGYAQTGVQIQFYSGSSQTYAVDSTGKLYFSGDNLLIKTSSSSSDVTIPTSLIQKIVFTSVLATTEVVSNASKIYLYPNPTSDFIRIKSPAKEKLKVNIFSATGQLVLQGFYNPDQDIDVSLLSTGLYLVQANGVTIKFIKK